MSAPIEIHHTKRNPRQEKEEAFFASPKSMCSVADTAAQVRWKMPSIRMLEDMIARYGLRFAGDVLELAGGYGVMAAYLKAREGDDMRLTYTDVSPTAVKTSAKFEARFGASIDRKVVCEAETLPFPDASFDVVFFFAGFHHVQDPHQALKECRRVLKLGGRLYLLLEPAVPRLFDALYARYSARDGVDEFHFSRAEYRGLLARHFHDVRLNNYAAFRHRESNASWLYYLFLSCLPPFMRGWLPCSQVIVAVKTD